MKNASYSIQKNGDIIISYENKDDGLVEVGTINGFNFDGFGSIEEWIKDRNENLDEPYPDPLTESVASEFKNEYIKDRLSMLAALFQ